jgi:hypothetical protein
MLLHGWTSADCASEVTGPAVTAALRNPDLYLAGHRVDMVSSAAAFAEQVPGMTEAQVLAMSFYVGFLTSADRIGFWLSHSDPPGDNQAAVAARIAQFAASLVLPGREGLVVGVTQSPVLRAVASHFDGTDPGEPPYLSGFCVQVQGDGRLAVTPVGWKQAGAS